MMAPFVRVCCRPRTCPNSWAATWRRSMPAGWKDGGAHLVQTKSEDSFVCFDLLAWWGFCYLSPSSANAPERVIKSTSPYWLISTLSHTFHRHTDVISAAAVRGNKEFDLNLEFLHGVCICSQCTSFFQVLSGRFSDILLTGNIKLAAKCDKSTLWMYSFKKTWLKKWRCLPRQSWSQQKQH